MVPRQPEPLDEVARRSRLDTPVLLLIFNRPRTTKQVFEAVREAKPRSLHIAADGPRSHRQGESDLCEETRALVRSPDWDCTVQTLFRDHNLGCRKAVSQAISWFFENVDEGIILEDDCVPDASFFPYCSQLLARYRDDERVSMIAGSNYGACPRDTPFILLFHILPRLGVGDLEEGLGVVSARHEGLAFAQGIRSAQKGCSARRSRPSCTTGRSTAPTTAG